MKKINKLQLFAWLLAVLPLLLVAAVYSRLPAEIPMNWGVHGQVEYSEKWQLWIVSLLGPLLAILFPLLPKIDPRRRSYDKFRSSYQAFQLIMQLFIVAMVGICITEALRPGTVNVSMTVCLLCSLLFIYLGNVMPKFRPNFFCGFRNPWTLSSEAVWRRTHRLGGRMLFAAGLIGLAGAFAPSDVVRLAVLLVSVLMACIVPTVYSYLWFRQEPR